MNAFFEFFHQLFNFRSIIRELTEARDWNIKRANKWEGEAIDLNKAIRCRDYALESLATISPDSPPPKMVPIRLQRPSYSEAARQFERSHSARFREMDEKQ